MKTKDLLLLNLVRSRYGIDISTQQACYNHVSPFKAFSNAFFAKDKGALWDVDRNSGATLYLSLLADLEKSILGADVGLYAPSMVGALELKSVVEHFGGVVKPLNASTRSVRGPHPQRLRMDRINDMSPEVVMAALWQPMSSADVKSQTVLVTGESALAKSVPTFAVYKWCSLDNQF